MKLIKNIKAGKAKVLILFFNLFFLLFFVNAYSVDENIKSDEGRNLKIKILDKVSSKSSSITLEIGKEKEFKNLIIKFLKCVNSKFDDNPEITAYLQVKDKNNKKKDEVFVFNGWAFYSSPSLRPIDHPVYDIWVTSCF